MTASSSKGGKAGGRNHKFPCGTCWGCGDKGHFRDKCPKKSKDGKESKDSPKSSSANAAVGINSDSEGEGAFAAVAVKDYESDDSMPDLQAVSDSDSNDESPCGVVTDSDWFSEAADEGVMDQECSEGSDWDPADLFEDSVPAIDAQFALEDPGIPEHVVAFLPTNKIFRLLEKARWLSTYLMELTSRSCASQKFSMPLKLDTRLCLLDDSTTMVFRPLLEVASVSFEVLMGRNLVPSPNRVEAYIKSFMRGSLLI
ncbi:hypothetical protein K443DRAFT_112864 [Laccaria amethystina LaAM-08-1]|uniref:CCHC-type domain-containing protein n=1 Tax=Laccaria amethystina LaAM-08-1 TaxID=1095629 RepID=A0A0C9X5K4_9AGAR|nr:hypothetical protein K443DRAFT_112864 [Laccaria amethystina LaAM-08-1]